MKLCAARCCLLSSNMFSDRCQGSFDAKHSKLALNTKLPYGDLVFQNGYFNLSFAGKNKRLVMIEPSLCNVERISSTGIAFMSPLLLTLHLVVGFVLVITIYINLDSSIRKSHQRSSREVFKPQHFLNAQPPIAEFCRLPEQAAT